MHLYFQYLSIHLRSQLAHRLSFFLLAFGQFVLTFLYFISVFLLFSFFGAMNDWGFWEVMLCTGLVQTAYPLAEFFARGFDSFSGLVKSGDFDRLLVRPRSIVFQVFCSRVEFNRIGRLCQGLFVLILALVNVAITWTPGRVLLLGAMLAGMISAFMGVFIVTSTVCFFTVEGLEISNILTDGGREISQYPLGIYKRGFLHFFTFIIPYAAATYYPLLYLTGRSSSPLLCAAPVLAMLFILPAVAVFRLGVRHYLSTGS